jgi:hypothetical protein
MTHEAATAHLIGERGHLPEHLVHVDDDVPPVDEDRLRRRRAQRHVKHSAPLGDVDLLAREHGLDARRQRRFLGELHEQAERLVQHSVFGIVEVEPTGFGDEPLAATGVVLK